MPKPRKLIDITPPRQRAKAREESSAKKQAARNSRRNMPFPKGKGLLALSIVFAAFLLFFSLHIFFAKAEVRLYPVSRQLVLNDSFFVRSGVLNVDATAKTLPGTFVSQERSGTKLFSSTGVDAKATKAEGIIRVFNNQAKTQVLVATTRFISEDGKLFRSKARITIPAGGFTDVEVVAAEPGSEYNSGPSNFSLPGLLGSPSYTAVYGKSFAAMAGGGNAETKVVTEGDLENAQELLLQELMNQAKKDLSQSVSSPFALLEKSMKEQVVQVSQSVEKGAQVSQFSTTGEVQVQALSYNNQNVEVLAKEVLAKAMAQGEKLQEGTLRINLQDAIFSSASQQGTLKLEIQTKVYQDIDEEELSEKLLGKNESQAQQILLDYPQIEKFEFSFFPFWKKSMPKAKESLRVNLVF